MDRVESMVQLLKPLVSRFGVTSVRGFPSMSKLSYWHQEALQQTMQELDVEIAIVFSTVLLLKHPIEIRPYLYRLSSQATMQYSTKWRTDPIIWYWLDHYDKPDEAAEQFIQQAS